MNANKGDEKNSGTQEKKRSLLIPKLFSYPLEKAEAV